MLDVSLRSAGPREPRALPQSTVPVMIRAFLLVTPAGLTRDLLTACICRLDEQCEVAYAIPGATPPNRPRAPRPASWWSTWIPRT